MHPYSVTIKPFRKKDEHRSVLIFSLYTIFKNSSGSKSAVPSILMCLSATGLSKPRQYISISASETGRLFGPFLPALSESLCLSTGKSVFIQIKTGSPSDFSGFHGKYPPAFPERFFRFVQNIFLLRFHKILSPRLNSKNKKRSFFHSG